MPLRLLIIDNDPEVRKLLWHHASVEWPDVKVTEHEPASQGLLPQGFIAAGYDLVLLDGQEAPEQGIEWLRDLKRRPGFPPVIFLARGGDQKLAVTAIKSGASDFLPKDELQHDTLVQAIREAVRERKRQKALLVRSGERDEAYRFGSVIIRGQRFVRELASGGVSSVYLAESERQGAMVVLKVLRQVPDVAEGKSAFDRFIQEYEVISRIDHPNVVRIFDLGVADDHAYIAMEYFSKGDLRQRINAGLLPGQALEIVRQIAQALAVIHDVGVLHRDLKPGNVMLRDDGTMALIDFGLAKELEVHAEITEKGEIFGTPYYMSPEQGHADTVDERSDLYSLGVILFELLSGRKPFMAKAPMAVIYMHSHAEIPRLPERVAQYQEVVDRLLAKEPANRFQSAEELLLALDDLEVELG
jgi:DNA-binding response OmpR family regulator